MNYSNRTTGTTSTYTDMWNCTSTTSNAVIWTYNNGGWQRLYRGPAVCSFDARKQEEITKEDIDALL